MPFNYNKLWKLLIDKSMNKVALRDAVGITSSTLARLSKNENVSLDVLGRICEKLECNIGDIVDYVREDDAIDEKHTVQRRHGEWLFLVF